MRLPIEHVPNSRPPRFRWTATIDMIGGVHTSSQEGCLPSGVDVAVLALIRLCEDLSLVNGGLDVAKDDVASAAGCQIVRLERERDRLTEELEKLRILNEGLTERVAAQSELLSKKSEKVVPIAGTGQISAAVPEREAHLVPSKPPTVTPIRKGR